MLPRAHTCFFSFDWPDYSSKDIARDRLLTAIMHCQVIDMDFNADISAWGADAEGSS